MCTPVVVWSRPRVSAFMGMPLMVSTLTTTGVTSVGLPQVLPQNGRWHRDTQPRQQSSSAGFSNLSRIIFALFPFPLFWTHGFPETRFRRNRCLGFVAVDLPSICRRFAVDLPSICRRFAVDARFEFFPLVFPTHALSRCHGIKDQRDITTKYRYVKRARLLQLSHHNRGSLPRLDPLDPTHSIFIGISLTAGAA